ncbi:ATP synthase F1 subunit epsilon [Opitutaceae bacterium TAV4]|uniref:ATP synthase F1 subunit epsilon n=1 Tax=Geminisphaera colitermitum TaxID=1148786 RepID=UPI000158CDEE|nr:ATP synthase F1 subunit epsilon [Geminisphaera colitermitum]RRJ95313.1 ATP synthase F1 subunit epsilon [Opitutaceae bacterium TAV4]RRJ99550.1 ATP synthase F1 subunit epsilon [Opitutaceae bacterium TAV3]
MPLTLEIITPEARVYSDTIDTVVIPTVMGEIGILPGHMPLLTQVSDGELRVTKNGQTEHLIVSGGFAQVEGDTVSVLAEHAIDSAKIDPAAAEAAMKRAEEALKNPDKLDPAEKNRYENLVRFAVAQINIKHSRR